MIGGTVRRAARPVAQALTSRWPPYSRLFLVGEGNGWVIDHELRELASLAAKLDVRLADRRLRSAARRQAVFYGSHFALLDAPWRPSTHRIATAYFHGRPGTPGMPEFDRAYETLVAHHAEIARIQVSHSEMEDLVLGSGVDPAKVIRIPIAIRGDLFSPQTRDRKRAARAALGLPQDAFVVGSFQKDGQGLGAGLEPKSIKGPDVLLDALSAVQRLQPDLHVLLSGPARGWVRRGLEQRGIPHVHRHLARYEEIGSLYDALDAYVVASRQEGGPKGVLEAMAGGVPLVATRVGQAMDLVRDGVNGWMVEVDDAEALAQRLAEVAEGPARLGEIVAAGLETARENTYEAHLPRWRRFFDGFVESS